MPTVQDTYEYMLQSVAVLLAPENFRRSRADFCTRLSNGRVRWRISFQRSQYSTVERSKFTIWVHAEWRRRPAYYEPWEPQKTWYGGAGNRIGYLMPQKEDTWWEIDKVTAPSLLSAQISGVLWSCALPFLRQFEREEDIERYLRATTEHEMKHNTVVP